MAWSISDLIPPWGDPGERWADNFQYEGGDQVNEKHLDYLISSVGTLEDEVRSALADIDADKDGVVDAAESISGLVSDIDLNGNSLVDGATDIYNSTKGWVPMSTLEGEPFAYETGHTNWSDALTDAEVHRIDCQTGETLVVERVEFQQKGGGSSTNASVDVYDATAAAVVGSATLGSVTKDPGSGGAGNTILVRIDNSTGSTVEGTLRVNGYIQGA